MLGREKTGFIWEGRLINGYTSVSHIVTLSLIVTHQCNTQCYDNVTLVTVLLPRMDQKLKLLDECMTDHVDFPKAGIVFKNIMPLFSDPGRMELLADVLEETIRTKFPNCTKLVGLESRGFLMGKS